MTDQNRETKKGETSPPSRDLEAQRQYARRMAAKGFGFDLMVADAFVRGMRDIGYRSTATALDELIDNAIQAEAQKIGVCFGYTNSDAKPSQIAVVDDGHGMDPDMIRLAIIWGGTHRENDRQGFGRYGYGLPSASLSQGRRFSVYSRTADGEWHAVTLDVDELAGGAYNQDGRIVAPAPTRADPPEWVKGYVKKVCPAALQHGTVVVLDRLEPGRLTWKTTAALQRNLLEHFGVTYRNFLREVDIWVGDEAVQPVDPLFLMPGGRFYDLDDERAEALEPLHIEIKDEETRDVLGTIKVRFAYMPPTFQYKKEHKDKAKSARSGVRTWLNQRFPIMKDHNGIIVTRQGRQIDVLRTCPWTSFQSDDYNWAVEIDFPATLDEEFSITTSKQQVVLSERIWTILKEKGVHRAIQELRDRYARERGRVRASGDADPSQKRASEQAVEQAAKYKTRKPADDTPERRQRAQEALNREIERRTRETGVSREEVERQIVAEIKGRPYKVEKARLSAGGPFYYPELRGGQRVLVLNEDHRFYTKVYAGPESTPRLRAAIEVLLWAQADSEIDATDERRQFYESERGEWSNRLHTALGELEKFEPTESPSAPVEASAVSNDDAPAAPVGQG